MEETLTQTVEDYLKTIYELNAHGGRASTNQIAAAMGVTPASASGMVKRLSKTEPSLLQYEKSRGVILTEAGKLAALRVLRSHRLLEMYLVQVLGYDWDMVHSEADRLEHAISQDFEMRIDEALGYPTHDPHGDPIPSQDLSMPACSIFQLFQAQAGQRAVIHRVCNDDPHFLRYLSSQSLVPKTIINILERSPFDDNIKIQLESNGAQLTLGPAVTRQIYIEILETGKHEITIP